MVFEILEFIIGLVLVLIGIVVVVVSNDMITERNKQRREGTHDYYGNKIEEDDDK